MQDKERKYWAVGLILFAVFVVFTITVQCIDVKAIGPKGSVVGYSKLNQKFAGLVGVNESFYKTSEVLGYLALVLVAIDAVRGLVQWISRKSLVQVDIQIFMLGLFLVVLLIFYALFEFIPVNFRPVLEDGELASSYPSSHSMLAVFVYLAGSIELTYSLKKKWLCTLKTVTFSVLAFLTIVTRALSGYHWLTDIVGALLLASGLVLFYKASLVHFTVGENK